MKELKDHENYIRRHKRNDKNKMNQTRVEI